MIVSIGDLEVCRVWVGPLCPADAGAGHSDLPKSEVVDRTIRHILNEMGGNLGTCCARVAIHNEVREVVGGLSTRKLCIHGQEDVHKLCACEGL